MEKPHRNEAIIISVLLFGAGFGMVMYGLNEMNNANSKYDKAISDPLVNPHIKSVPLITPISDSLIYKAGIYYQTVDMLSVNNPFNYSIIASVKNPDQFNKIVAIPYPVVNDVINPPPTTEGVLSDSKNQVYWYNITLNRNFDDDTFRGSDTNYKVGTEENLGFLLIPYTNNTARGLVFFLQVFPLKIHPEIEEYQLQTDRDTQRQTIESSRSNSHVDGLTMVIIGLVPIALSLEIWIHRRLT